MPPLDRYRARRDFGRTPEPAGGEPAAGRGRFVVQEHAARRHHYDVRLELDGVLKSWAVPKGPSLDPAEKRLAVEVEDHPLEYAEFEGVIPEGEYGGGTVVVWDRGTWAPRSQDPAGDLHEGKLEFSLEGEKLRGVFVLVRLRREPDADGVNWLLMKKRDRWARPGDDAGILEAAPASVASGRTLAQVAADRDRVWTAAGEVAGEGSAPPPSGRDPAGLPGAVAGPVPSLPEPALATPVERPPGGQDWLHEIKFDGYRVLCRVEGGVARLLTRGGLDWTARFGVLARRLARFPARDALLDGEVVVIRPDGTTSFDDLQAALAEGRTGHLVYQAFDLLHLDGQVLLAVPLLDRKAALAERVAAAGEPALRYTDHVLGAGPAFFRQACRFALEGVVSKRARAPYRPGRTRDWRKVRCGARQEFVVGGWTDPRGGRTGFGALLLGVQGEGGLQYAGRVGTGFDDRTLRALAARLEALAAQDSPFVAPPRERGLHWVRPELVAEVEFTGWTTEGRLRHPAFRGLREDRDPADVVREPGPVVAATTEEGDMAGREDAAVVAGVRISSPGKVLYPEQGVTKAALAAWCEVAAEAWLPHVVRRPLTLKRCPQGSHRDCFFQKHAGPGLPEAIHTVPIAEKKGTKDYLFIEDLQGLVSLVQLGVLEVHIWGSRVEHLEQPDRMVFDLDPDEGLPWERVVEAAFAVRSGLRGMDLPAVVMTTGGKGLHVVVPLRPRWPWPAVKDFSVAFARRMAEASPSAYTATLTKARRVGRVLVDALRNARGATAVSPWSFRARPRATVAVPLAWDEVDIALRPDRWTVETAPRRLGALEGDPWAGVEAVDLGEDHLRALGMDPGAYG